LGKPSLIQTVFSNDAKIIRSKYPEIEWYVNDKHKG
jgi:hypothetical protein